jgi:hypothetical protein
MLLFTLFPRQEMEVQLSVPDAAEECPMMLEPMMTTELDFLKGVNVIENNSLIKKMTLKCGHSFSAVPALYHFSKSGLKCPLCRQGVDGELDFECLPVHLMEAIQKRISETRVHDQQEEESQNIRDAWFLFWYQLIQTPETFVGEDNIKLAIYCYDEDDTIGSIASMQYSMKVQMTSDELHLVLSRADVRDMCRTMRLVGDICVLQFSIGMHFGDGTFMMLDQSHKLKVQDLRTNMAVFGRGYGYFSVEVIRCEEFVDNLSRITDLKWVISLNNVNTLMERPNRNMFINVDDDI